MWTFTEAKLVFISEQLRERDHCGGKDSKAVLDRLYTYSVVPKTDGFIWSATFLFGELTGLIGFTL